MNFFISFFLSPLALSLYCILAGVLILPRMSNAREGSPRQFGLGFLMLGVFSFTLMLIFNKVFSPVSFRSNMVSVLGAYGVYIFAVLSLLCLWGVKRDVSASDDLFDNFTDKRVLQQLHEKGAVKFSKFIFLFFLVVSLFGFVVSENQRKIVQEMREWCIEYNSKVKEMRDVMRETYEHDRVTRELYNNFYDSLSHWREMERYYDKVVPMVVPQRSENEMIRESCESYLKKMEYQLIRKEELAKRYDEKNAEFMSELQLFISQVPNKLDEVQYKYNVETLLFIHDSYSQILYSYAEAEEFSPAAAQLYQECVQELENRRQVKD